MKSGDLFQTQRYLLNKNNSYSIIYNYKNNSLEFFSNKYIGDDPRINSQILLIDSYWHYIVYTYDNSKSIFRGYKDGKEIFSNIANFTIINNSQIIEIGSAKNGTLNFFSGSMRDLRIYNSILTADEIENNYLLMCGGNICGTGDFTHLKYYGYYGVDPFPLENVSNYTNVFVVGSVNYIKNASQLGLKTIYGTILSDSNSSTWDSKFSSLKTNLQNQGINLDDIAMLYIIDEPRLKNGWNNSLVINAVSKAKNYFPNKTIMINFNSGGAIDDGIIPPENLDLIGIDPYIYPNSTQGCEQRQEYDDRVKPLLSWAKSFNKSIILVGRSYEQLQPRYYPMPSSCQQNWYYETAKSEPQVIGLLWFKYANKSSGGEVLIGTNAFPDIIAFHRQIGKEILG